MMLLFRKLGRFLEYFLVEIKSWKDSVIDIHCFIRR